MIGLMCLKDSVLIKAMDDVGILFDYYYLKYTLDFSQTYVIVVMI